MTLCRDYDSASYTSSEGLSTVNPGLMGFMCRCHLVRTHQ